MTNTKKDLYSKREFLNKGVYHSTAAVCATLEHETDDMYNPLYSHFSISNCDRAVNLDVDTSSLEDLENSVHKMTQIEETARGMKEALIKAKPILEQWLEEKLREENKEKEAN